jgi:hypothetical protein
VSENDFNYSQNPTAFVRKLLITGSRAIPFFGPVSGSGTPISSSFGQVVDGAILDFMTSSFFRPYTTTVGLYNENNQLLVVGKLATPYPIPANTDMTFIVKWDS